MANFFEKLKDYDSDVFAACDRELSRQQHNIELIASENIVSEAVLLAAGGVLTNKYAEGYPGKRYYGGCIHVDEVEEIARQRACKLFGADHANVQPHSGANANLAVFFALLTPGDTVMGMNLAHGGHLTHGSPVNISGSYYNFVPYGVNDDGFIDYDAFEKTARETKPKLIVAGASAYPRVIDFERISKVAKEIGAYFMVDMAHIAGLVATGFHQSPFGYADVVTTTTHKTLRGPRGGLIFCLPEYKKLINSAVFPGTQGGPLENMILAKAICAEEALTPDYKDYIRQVIVNAKAMAEEFIRLGYKVITDGTDTHMLLIDFTETHPDLTGLMVQEACDKENITLNRNCVPNEKRSSYVASGVRIGTPAMTTRGWMEEDFIECARKIDQIIKAIKI